MQVDALKKVGCDHIFTDKGISAVAKKRPGFEQALDLLKSGDTFVIWKMDRAFRSLRHALDIFEQFEQGDIHFCFLTDQIDTTTPMGRFMYQIHNVFAELERNLISERTKAGMEAAKKLGVKLGRPKKLSDEQIKWAQNELTKKPNQTHRALAKKLGVSIKTISRVLKR